MGGVEKWGDKAQTWEPISAVEHLEQFESEWKPRIKQLQEVCIMMFVSTDCVVRALTIDTQIRRTTIARSARLC